MFKKLIKHFAKHMEEIMLFILILYIAGCTVLQVVMRKIFNNSLSWSEESIRYAFIWLVMLGFGVGVRDKKHIRIKAIQNLVAEKYRFLFDLFSDAVFLAFSIYMIYHGVFVIKSFFDFAQTSPSLKIPMQWVYLAAPAGFFLTALRLAYRIYDEIKSQFRKKKGA